jgi:hypothetical protein
MMAGLTDLTKVECALLTEVLEKQQKELESGDSTTQTRNRPGDKSSREETVRRLLWRLRGLCSAIPDPSELRECGGYC